MAEEFTGHNFEAFEKFMNKNINLLNEEEYNIKSIRYNLNLYEKEEKQKKLLEQKRNRESDPKEKEEEEEEIKSLDFDSDIEEKSTKQETKGQQENEDESESIPSLFDFTKANEYRPNNLPCSDDELSESFSQAKQNKKKLKKKKIKKISAYEYLRTNFNKKK